MYLARVPIAGKNYWVLQKAFWDKTLKRNIRRYMAYIGKERRISPEKAREIIAKLGCSLSELKKVRGLKIACPPAKRAKKPP